MIRHINSREINEALAVDDRVVVEVEKDTQDFLWGSRNVERMPIVASSSAETRCFESDKELDESRIEQPTLVIGVNRRVFLRTLSIDGCSV